MRGSSQLLAEDLGQLLERDLHLEHVLPLALAGLPRARLLVARRERLARLALALADAALLLLAEAEVRDVDSGRGMETKSFPFFPIISPCEMYFLRFCLILPRTICGSARGPARS